MFVVNLVFLKIFIAIILQGYNDMQTQDGRLFNIDMNEKFRDTWKNFDPDATTFIKMNDLRPFLFALGAPLGFDKSYRNR
jgi:Voltage-dependent L-type calcium channel, IQ-associated